MVETWLQVWSLSIKITRAYTVKPYSECCGSTVTYIENIVEYHCTATILFQSLYSVETMIFDCCIALLMEFTGRQLIIEFASGEFIGSESSGFIEVIVRIIGGSSSTPITVTVAPSAQSPVSARGRQWSLTVNICNYCTIVLLQGQVWTLTLIHSL